MNMKIIKFIALLLVFAGGFASCKNNDNIDMSEIGFSNIDSLYAQPLPVIQKCVEGKWKCIQIITYGFVGIHYPSNAFVNIKNDSVAVTGDDCFIQANSFSYSWEKKETSLDYTTYVMEDIGWFFDKIRNDTLAVVWDGARVGEYSPTCLFIRIK